MASYSYKVGLVTYIFEFVCLILRIRLIYKNRNSYGQTKTKYRSFTIPLLPFQEIFIIIHTSKRKEKIKETYSVQYFTKQI